jgi:hypothetical protein
MSREESYRSIVISRVSFRIVGFVAQLAVSIVIVLSALGCTDRDLRGYSERSQDGRTYLVVDDDNGGGCGPILVDGKQWPHALHTAGPIGPGEHVIECGGEIGFKIKRGTTFHFDYWGP